MGGRFGDPDLPIQRADRTGLAGYLKCDVARLRGTGYPRGGEQAEADNARIAAIAPANQIFLPLKAR